ncbi:MAG TPA: GMC family oxidoreductase N-terminal domain-containing protein [Hyphomicrobiaceae bacterium]|nr:GMC family oxidoreductase N-terminal domain-containing protein [Hyphomicrobiaceae bacterium]
MGEPLDTYDYVIVGAGSAGCLLANRLSADAGARVLLIEAGGSDDYIWVHIPVGYLYCFGNPRVDWGYTTAAEPGLNGRSIAYPRGKVLGGCSSINGMIYMRGQARDYDHWRQLGCVGWSWSDVLPYFLKHEDQRALDPQDFNGVHARGGEWRVEEPRARWRILDAWADAAEQAGIPKVKDFNSGNNEGSGYFHVNQRAGVRWNAAKAFLRPAMKRQNLSVLTNALVERLLLQGRRVSGVAVRRNGLTFTLAARREVILSAGAIGSPQILQLSGIGPGEWLQRLGIAVQHHCEGVGANLQDHLQIRCAYKVSGIETLNERSRLWHKLAYGVEYALKRTGPLSMAPSHLGTFARSDPSRETPNLQYHVQPLTMPRYGTVLDPFPAFTASVCNLRPTSRGYVAITSPDPAAAPEIRPNYLSTEDDRRVAADAIRLTRRIVSQPALALYNPIEFRPGAEVEGDEALAKAAGDIATTIFHPVGTCRMGSDEGAVVDPRLKVRGLEGLRIIDASIMPTITSGNTNSPTLMIAEKGAALVLEDWKG